MRPRFVGRLGPADAITVANAMLGFVAVAVATVEPRLAARFVLLAAMGDGLDGVVARRWGGTPVGEYLDSLSDVAAFGVAPAMIVFAVARQAWAVPVGPFSVPLVIAIGMPALYLGMVVVRLGFYTVNDTHGPLTTGVPSTLAATLIAAAVLARAAPATTLVASTAVLCMLMIVHISYPDLLARDTLIMGVVQGLAVVVPDAFGRAFPYALLTLGLAYLVLAPRFYWRDTTIG